ncbi:SDR family NAD(P)-dependent oxidoreductase [Agromyces sp. SYSU T00194]|uniref:SDR family NAD(P)-dependent oxidoreductase n=1 Tax=Agromyces chitinivorans TaxID=3158560 RepID=UPI003392AAFA
MQNHRTVIVTGAGGGIGEATATLLAARDWDVVVADLDADRAGAVANAILERGDRAVPHVVDMSDPASVAQLVDFAAARSAPLVGLVNNAGIAIAKPLVDYSVAEWDLQLSVNLRGAFLAIQAIVPHFRRTGGGRIVNIASTAAFVSSSTPEAAYDVSKAGIRQLTTSAAVELAPLGIGVNAVAPGTIATPLTTAVLDDPEKLARAGAKIPAGRLGDPRDIAGAVAFLLGEDAAYVHGHTLVVDGGWLAL